MAIAFLGYFAFLGLSWFIIYRQYKKANRLFICKEKSVKDSVYLHKKMPVWCIVVIALLFSLYNYVITTEAGMYGGDRTNYLANYLGYRSSESSALNAIMSFSRSLGLDYNIFLCLVTFINTAITLTAYRLSKDANPYAFYLLCLTQYFFISLTAIKQVFAFSLATVFFVLVTEYNTMRSRVTCIIIAIVASLFHTTGFILFPLFIVLTRKIKIKGVLIFFSLLVLFMLFFGQIIRIIQKIVSPVIPSFGNKLQQYFADTGSSVEGGGIHYIKGLPFYFIVGFGILARKRLVQLIDNYDKYLIIAGTGATLFAVSYYSYWFMRFIYLFIFSSVVFWTKISKKISNFNDRVLANFVVQGGFAVITFRLLYLVYSIYGGF